MSSPVPWPCRTVLSIVLLQSPRYTPRDRLCRVHLPDTMAYRWNRLARSPPCVAATPCWHVERFALPRLTGEIMGQGQHPLETSRTNLYFRDYVLPPRLIYPWRYPDHEGWPVWKVLAQVVPLTSASPIVLPEHVVGLAGLVSCWIRIPRLPTIEEEVEGGVG